MANITSLPVEVLHIIFKYLDKLRRRSTSAAIIYGGAEWDRSIFEAMRVCRLWRDVVFDVYFGNDSSTWTRYDFRQNVKRIKYVDSLPERLQQRKMLKHGGHGSNCPDCSLGPTSTKPSTLRSKDNEALSEAARMVPSDAYYLQPTQAQTQKKNKRRTGRTWRARVARKLMKRWIRSMKHNSKHNAT